MNDRQKAISEVSDARWEESVAQAEATAAITKHRRAIEKRVDAEIRLSRIPETVCEFASLAVDSPAPDTDGGRKIPGASCAD
jgi:hypothetical protein